MPVFKYFILSVFLCALSAIAQAQGVPEHPEEMQQFLDCVHKAGENPTALEACRMSREEVLFQQWLNGSPSVEEVQPTPEEARLSPEQVRRELTKILNEIQSFEAPTSEEGIDKANKRADAHWRFFDVRRQVSVPAIRTFVKQHLSAHDLSDYAKIDLGYYLASHGEGADRALALEALLALDFDSRVSALNKQEIFQFVIELAQTGDTRLLPLMQAQYFEKDETYWGGNPAHPLMDIKGPMLTAFLFGTMGERGESYLTGLLSEGHERSPQIVRALNWIGSPKSIPFVIDYVKSNPTDEVVKLTVGYLMRLGGPEGRKAVMALPNYVTNEETLEYLNKIMPNVEATNSVTLARNLENKFKNESHPAKISDAKLKQHFQIMLKHKGRNPFINPLAVLNSGRDDAYLLKQLLEVRMRTYWGLDRENWDNVPITNYLINTLQYRIAGE